MNLSKQILSFLSNLESPTDLPSGVEVMNPYRNPTPWKICEQFYNQYYSDNEPRTMILGINPGRLGGGVTGIPFTDPIKLQRECGIENTFTKKAELSADFIYQMIQAYGGPDRFYSRFYVSSISPLGFTLHGKNLNYYDLPELEKKLTPFIIESLAAQLRFGIFTTTAYCLGEGKNFQFLSRINNHYHFFQKIVPLAHPRFIMQYRRKKLQEYIADYLAKFNAED